MRDAGQTADGLIQTVGRSDLESVPLCCVGFTMLLQELDCWNAESDVGDSTAGGGT